MRLRPWPHLKLFVVFGDLEEVQDYIWNQRGETFGRNWRSVSATPPPSAGDHMAAVVEVMVCSIINSSSAIINSSNHHTSSNTSELGKDQLDVDGMLTVQWLTARLSKPCWRCRRSR